MSSKKGYSSNIRKNAIVNKPLTKKETNAAIIPIIFYILQDFSFICSMFAMLRLGFK